LIDRCLLDAANRVGEHFRRVISVKVDAGVLQGRSHPAPVAGERLLREKTVLSRRGYAGRPRQVITRVTSAEMQNRTRLTRNALPVAGNLASNSYLVRSARLGLVSMAR